MGRVKTCTESFCCETDVCFNDQQPCARHEDHTGPCRCTHHQQLADARYERRRIERTKIPPTKFTPIDDLPPVWPTGKEGGFTPAAGPGKVAPAAFDEAKTYPQHYSDVALEKNLYAGDPVFDKMKKLFDEKQRSAVMKTFAATSEQLGNAARLSASGPNLEEKNRVLALAQDEFRKRNFENEQLLRGLLVRSDRVKSAEEDATFRYRQANASQARADELQRKLDTAATVTQTQARKIEELEKRERDGYWRKLAEDRAAELQTLKDPKWTTADRRTLRPSEFVNGHLTNTIRFIENLQPDVIFTDYDGDAAGADEIVVDRGPDTVPVYPLLLKEARKRGLLICRDRVKIKPAEIVEIED